MKKAWLLVLVLVIILVGPHYYGSLKDRFLSGEGKLKQLSNLEQEVAVPEELIKDLQREKVKVQLYFPRRDGKGLSIEERQIDMTEGIARSTLQELLEGPENKELKTVIPAGTRLLDINIKPDGFCVVNFSSELSKINSQDARLAVYSIVNTVSQFPTVDKVQFLIEGKPVKYLGSSVDLTKPVAAEYDLVKQQ